MFAMLVVVAVSALIWQLWRAGFCVWREDLGFTTTTATNGVIECGASVATAARVLHSGGAALLVA
jgi:hypothetical protein